MDTREPNYTMQAFLLISVLTLVGVGMIAPSVAQQREQKKERVIQQWVSDVQRMVAAHPERFTAYQIESLQCTLNRSSFVVLPNGDIQNPVKCLVRDVRGRSVDFSREFFILIVDARLSRP